MGAQSSASPKWESWKYETGASVRRVGKLGNHIFIRNIYYK